jgi:hypothetical protein
VALIQTGSTLFPDGEDWTSFADEGGSTRTYCPACSDRAASLRVLIGEEPA